MRLPALVNGLASWLGRLRKIKEIPLPVRLSCSLHPFRRMLVRGPRSGCRILGPRERCMNIEKYTDRARGFIQSAQSLALREGHQQFTPEHVLKVLLDDPEGLAAGLIDRSGGNSRQALQARRRGARQDAEGLGRRRRPGLSRGRDRAAVRQCREDRREGRRQLRHGRAAPAGDCAGEGQRRGENPRARRRHAAEPQRCHRAAAQGPHRRLAIGGERL